MIRGKILMPEWLEHLRLLTLKLSAARRLKRIRQELSPLVRKCLSFWLFLRPTGYRHMRIQPLQRLTGTLLIIMMVQRRVGVLYGPIGIRLLILLISLLVPEDWHGNLIVYEIPRSLRGRGKQLNRVIIYSGRMLIREACSV